MSFLRNYLNQIKPNFEEGGKLHAFRSVFDGFETFLYVPNTTAKSGASIHDAIDSKRIMSMVVRRASDRMAVMCACSRLLGDCSPRCRPHG